MATNGAIIACEHAPDWVIGRKQETSRRAELAECGLRRTELAESGLERKKWRGSLPRLASLAEIFFALAGSLFTG